MLGLATAEAVFPAAESGEADHGRRCRSSKCWPRRLKPSQGTRGLADALLKDLAAAQDAACRKPPRANDTEAPTSRAIAWMPISAAARTCRVEEVKDRKAFYRALNKLNRAALCCSGGGIRSATFCLGVIQALAAYDVGGLLTAPADNAASPDPDKTPAEAKADGVAARLLPISFRRCPAAAMSARGCRRGSSAMNFTRSSRT